MSRKHFSWLLILTVVVAVLVLLFPGRTSHDSDIESQRLLPGLQEQVNDLDWLQVQGAGNAVIATLHRGDHGWVLDEAHGYPVDWTKLKVLLSALSQAEIVETKTDNPDYYERLGVEDIVSPDAGGLQLSFAEGSGLPAVIVGDNAQGRDGNYVRLQGQAASALVDRRLNVPRTAPDWLDRSVVHVADSEVVQVDIRHPDGALVEARKASADDEHFVLQDIPDGREIQSDWAVDSLANSLASLTFDDVQPADRLDWSGAVRFGLVTADGLRIDAELLEIAAAEGAEEPGGAYWMRLEAGLYQTGVGGPAAEPETVGGEDAGEAAGDETPADAKSRAGEINQRTRGWAYRIPKYKFDGMTKRLDDLLKPENEGAGSDQSG